MRRLFVLLSLTLAIILVLCCPVYAANASSTLLANVWSLSDRGFVYRFSSANGIGNGSGVASVISSSKMILDHKMSWRSLFPYLGDSAAHLVFDLGLDDVSDNYLFDNCEITIPFSFGFALDGDFYFALEAVNAYVSLVGGSLLDFDFIVCRLNGDFAGQSSISIPKIDSSSFATNRRVEFYGTDLVGTVSSLSLRFVRNSKSAYDEHLIDHNSSCYFDLYLSSICAGITELIPSVISVPDNIIGIEDQYIQSIDDLYSDDWDASSILDVLSSLSSDFRGADMAMAFSWWQRAFTGVTLVEPLKTIFYVFLLVTVVKVILGLNPPSILSDGRSRHVVNKSDRDRN